ncbi:glutamate receptor ionotropic, kainate 5 [Nephila pilipes]|uniref:Glutamate receptor ionotropic, kainate 5 n=1 Tax=Nephila pilipes TaxID=299642 RepID=A0A8X6QJW1_NEPPI|nr:glutamate receptor ionotropic, kainate 5 [Nephila pilipes]
MTTLPLKIALLANGPYVVNVSTIEIIGGFEVGFLEVILKGLQLPYSLTIPEKLVWGNPDKNGNWSGVMGMVQRGEADMAIGSIFVTQARMTVADFSTPYTWQDITFATRMPGQRPKETAFMWPFSLQLWIGLAITIVFMTFIFRFCLTNIYSIRKLVFEIIGTLLHQSIEVQSSAFRDRCLILSWVCSCMFLSFGYTAVLLSFLSVPLKERPVETVDQLAKLVAQGKFRCFSAIGSGVAVSMMNSVYESHTIVGSFIENNKMYLDLQNKRAIAKFMNEGGTAWVVTRERIQFDSQDMYYISRDKFFSFPVAIALNKQFRYSARLNKLVDRISAAGLYEKTVGDYLFKKLISNSDSSENNSVKELALDDLFGAFVILISGCALSILICLAEIIHSKYTSKQSNSLEQITLKR